jgi:gamma-glutamylcyclotransferase (GGCT)/AIG2-like uncharacterized protein YtfP
MDTLNKFFVYGTLLSGLGNHHLFGKSVVSANKAAVTGWRMYTHGGFPMCVPSFSDNVVVHGEIITVKDSDFKEVLGKLDRLEGYNPNTNSGLFVRAVVEATEYEQKKIKDGIMSTTSRSVLAYMYVGKQNQVASLHHIAHGDWRKHKEHSAVASPSNPMAME